MNIEELGNCNIVIKNITYLLKVMADGRLTSALHRELNRNLTRTVEKVKLFEYIQTRNIITAQHPASEMLLLLLLYGNIENDENSHAKVLINHVRQFELRHRWSKVHVAETSFGKLAYVDLKRKEILGIFVHNPNSGYLDFVPPALTNFADICQNIKEETKFVAVVSIDSHLNVVLNVMFFAIEH